MVHLINLLTAIFVGLKLSNVVDWSWWLVLSPTIFIAGVFTILTIIGMLVFAVLYFRDIYYNDYR